MKTTDIIANAKAAGRRSLDEATGKQVLATYGIAVPYSVTVQEPHDVNAALADLSPPFAVKVMSPDILHKSDVGGVAVLIAVTILGGVLYLRRW